MPLRRTLILAAAVLLAVVIAGFVFMLGARQPLEDARAAMQRGRQALTAGAAADAASSFDEAERSFREAQDGLSNPLTRIASVIPVIGRTPDAARAGAIAGVSTARAGDALAAGIEQLPGGVGALAPQDGTIPVEPLEAVGPALVRAEGFLADADRTLQGATTSLVPGLISDPLEEFQAEVSESLRTVSAAARLVEVLPSFLGADGPRTYFVGAQNPAELRGTGGLIGAYSTLTIEDGRMELGPFGPVQDLAEADGVEPPNPDYAARYDRFGGAGYWLNINMTPDVPSAATAIERLWEEVNGQRLDGTILADPHALARLMRGSPPVPVPGSEITVDAETLVPFVSNEAYEIFTNPAQRKRLLGDVAGLVLERYLSGDAGPPAEAGRAIADIAGDGHLLLHAADPETQRAFEVAGAAGGLLDPAGDYLSVVANNAGGNKVDYYLERSIRHDVRLLPGRVAEVTTEVRFRNAAPAEGAVPYVIGPFPGVSDAGENVMFLSVYAPRGARLLGAQENGGPSRGGLEEELGHPVAWTNLRIPSGESATVRYRWTVPDAWTGSDRSGAYRLTFQGQATIRPTRLLVRVTPPKGMRAIEVEGIGVEDGVATWRGIAGDTEIIEVGFGKPTAPRIVSDLLPAPVL